MDAEQLAAMQARFPAVRHPVVCTHPVTGKRYLYVNRNFVSHVEGLEPDQSTALFDRLSRQADYPEHQCRFRWSPDAVAFWDNRAVQHYAASDYWPHRRVMERASICGTRPWPEPALDVGRPVSRGVTARPPSGFRYRASRPR